MRPVFRHLFLAAALAPLLAASRPLSCPQAAPPSWALPAARLESVRVLSFPPDQPPVDGQAMPTMAPFKEWSRAGIAYQSWNMNFDAPSYKFQVECLYSGTDRYLRLDAPEVKQCVAAVSRHAKTLTFQCK